MRISTGQLRRQTIRKSSSMLLLIMAAFVRLSSAKEYSEKFLPSPSVAKQKELSALHQKAQQALLFCKNRNYNTTVCILADLGKHSGLKRLFVYNFKTETVAYSAMVSHGCGTMPWSWTWSKDKATFSNKDGSHCSSLGKYRIGKRGYSNWGIHVNYLLYGLEKSNSNALARQIVLHSWEKVPNEEVYPKGTPEGWGCPAVSDEAMRWLDKKLKTAKKPVLLWVYN